MRKVRAIMFCGLLYGFAGELQAQVEGSEYMNRMADPGADFRQIVDQYESAVQLMDLDGEEENAATVFAKWRSFWQARLGANADASFEAYFDALRSMSQSPICEGGSAYPANWNLLGPIELPRQEMGRIESVAMDPNNPTVVFAGAPLSGLWRTEDVTATTPVWENITDNAKLPGLGVLDILVDPDNSDIIYIATGLATYGGYGLGVMKTTNGTSVEPDWTFTDLVYDPSEGDMVVVRRLLMDPVDHDVIYAITDREVFKTTDGGATWPSLGFYAATSNDNAINLWYIAFDPLDNDNLIVAGTQVWRWSGTGSQWSEVTSSLSGLPVSGIDISPSGNSLFLLYKTIGDKRIDISTDGGLTWTLHTTTNAFGPLFAVSDVDADIMYIGDGQGTRVVHKSTDGGASFFTISNYSPENLYNGTSTHADIRALRLVSGSLDGLSDVLLAGTDGGVLYSTSAVPPSGTVVNWKNANGSGLAVSEFFGLSVSELAPERVVGGAQDNGLATYESGNWTNKVVGDAYLSVIGRNDADIVIGEKIGAAGPHLDQITYLKKSVDGGQTWSQNLAQPPWGDHANAVNVGYSPDIWNVLDRPMIAKRDGDVLIGFHDLFAYDHTTTTSVPLSDFTSYGVERERGCRAFAVAPSDENVIYFAFEHQTWDPDNLIKKKLWKTNDGGASWVDITGDLPVNWAGLTGVAVDPVDPERIWVSFNGVWGGGGIDPPYNGINRVYYSSTGGEGTEAWTDYSKGLPPLPIHSLVYERGSNDGLYVGTDAGIFYSNKQLYDADSPLDPDNDGWQCFNDGFPVCVVTELKVNYASNTIRAATFGRGIWESSLACPIAEVYSESATYATNTFLEARATITSEAVVPTGLGVNYRGGTEVHLTPGFHATEGSRFHAFIHPCNVPGNSFQPKSMQGGLENDGSDSIEQRPGRGLVLYPNPTRNAVTLRCLSLGEQTRSQVRFLDALGREVLSTRMKGTLAVVDVSALNGLFTVVVESERDRFVERIVVE